MRTLERQSCFPDSEKINTSSYSTYSLKYVICVVYNWNVLESFRLLGLAVF